MLYLPEAFNYLTKQINSLVQQINYLKTVVNAGSVDGDFMLVGDPPTAHTHFISDIVTSSLIEYKSMEEAVANLGENKYFYWAKDNLDGIVSPKGTKIGITKL